MGEYLLGLDAGNTVIKAVIFDRSGRELAYTGEEGHSRMPCPGHVERDLGELWANAKRVAKRAISGDAQVAAIGTATNYHADYVKPKWAKSMKRLIKIGRHVFYEDS